VEFWDNLMIQTVYLLLFWSVTLTQKKIGTTKKMKYSVLCTRLLSKQATLLLSVIVVISLCGLHFLVEDLERRLVLWKLWSFLLNFKRLSRPSTSKNLGWLRQTNLEAETKILMSNISLQNFWKTSNLRKLKSTLRGPLKVSLSDSASAMWFN
jgi:hypothetical protein